jgi:hypothetical protein
MRQENRSALLGLSGLFGIGAFYVLIMEGNPMGIVVYVFVMAILTRFYRAVG